MTRIVKLAGAKNRAVNWLRYGKILGIEKRKELDLDFILSAFESGIVMEPTFQPLFPDSKYGERIQRMLFTEEERRHRTLIAGSKELVI